YCDVHGENQIANAQFIAVAPKMLQALENIKKEVLDRMNDKAPSKYVENIIAEAKGENCEA
ncbi:hypothetical protein GWO43_12495, partial [candidate division KSB1 bacterium]|nr:hypothetical protein [candidate division KSB1 bacterium]NIS24935.1 hypothetical protein [candidate division KSB1 bacterium]NIT71681.1 hypothetical protein [candidate division KSB1 bacterium]NIU25899.1 hypothetical protein [candidate division KSB1 bacterium]NIU92187.1 hypothetical protein [candidate division KSB1 bacterium]